MSTAVAKSQYHIALIFTEPYILFSTTYARTMGRNFIQICSTQRKYNLTDISVQASTDVLMQDNQSSLKPMSKKFGFMRLFDWVKN